MSTIEPSTGQVLSHKHKVADLKSVAIVNTEAVILASTPSSGKIAYGTDTQFFYVADGSAWHQVVLPLGTRSSAVDIGIFPYGADNGYSASNLSNKYLHNIVIKHFNSQLIGEDGALRTNTTTHKLQVYLNGSWTNALAYTDAGENAIMLWTDIWQSFDSYGKNYIHGGKVDIGPLASDHILDGGVISDQIEV